MCSNTMLSQIKKLKEKNQEPVTEEEMAVVAKKVHKVKKHSAPKQKCSDSSDMSVLSLSLAVLISFSIYAHCAIKLKTLC